MSESVIVTSALSKNYAGKAAITDIGLEVPRSSVFGFLGPNGSGKTTTIRLLLGLQRPTAGRAEVLGHAAGDLRALARVGALVEMPSLYPNLTGIENLRVAAHYRGCDETACARALETVGLRDAANKVVKSFSLGMKQRLGLATALMHDPELLILDEPANGLDPAGILELRDLIRSLSTQRGVTVFVSSHLLSEIEQVATHLAVLSSGRTRFVGSVEAMRNTGRSRLVVGVSDGARATRTLANHGIPARETAPSHLTIDGSATTQPARINALLVNAGIDVHHLALERSSLEARFLELTKEDA